MRIGTGRRDVGRFILLVVAMIGIAAGQLFVLGDLETLVQGLPLWVWAHLGIVVLLLVLAWIATGMVTPTEEI